MDSKYAILSKHVNTHASPSSLLSGVKRKFSYGASDQSEQATKRANLENSISRNGTTKNGIPTTTITSASSSTAESKLTNGTNGASHASNIQAQRKQLPVYAVRTPLIKHLTQNDTLIVIGETGCGKTTQIPQFLLQAGLAERGAIAVTQPRRVAAITIASRVAKEMKCTLGETVGYTVRFEDQTSKNTRIKFVTDGSLLREALSDRMLKNYSAIVLDEAHERTINTDVLFGIVKEAQKNRKLFNMTPLKIIIMSATMDVDHFSKYFSNCKTIYLVGRTYPVKVMHTKEIQSDYVHACLSTLFQIHENAPANHDVLMFLTGQEEIESVLHQIRSLTKVNSLKGPKLRVYPLYAQLPQTRQMDVFHPSLQGTRKVILSTNIAETSLTIPGIKYVIDGGVVKRRTYDSSTGMDSLKVTKICKDQAWQRSGRAGRETDGYCYRAYTVKEYEAMLASTPPEILRSNIATTVLQLMAMGIECKTFDFIDAPPKAAIENAVKQLKLLGAIKMDQENELTQLGKNMAKFPLDPKYSKMLLSAPSFECLEEMLSIVAILSSEDVFPSFYDSEKRAEALTAHAKFENKFSDHLTLLNVFNAFPKTEKVKNWCQENYLNARNLSYAVEVRRQLSEICQRLDLEVDSCGNDFDKVRKCLLSGMFINLAELQRENHYLTFASRQKAKIHPSSVLSGKPRAKYIVFTELVSTGRNYMRNVTTIDDDWLDEIVPNLSQTKLLFNGSNGN